MRKTTKWYMPEQIGNSHVLEIDPPTGWSKFLPTI